MVIVVHHHPLLMVGPGDGGEGGIRSQVESITSICNGVVALVDHHHLLVEVGPGGECAHLIMRELPACS